MSDPFDRRLRQVISEIGHEEALARVLREEEPTPERARELESHVTATLTMRRRIAEEIVSIVTCRVEDDEAENDSWEILEALRPLCPDIVAASYRSYRFPIIWEGGTYVVRDLKAADPSAVIARPSADLIEAVAWVNTHCPTSDDSPAEEG